MGTWSTSIKGNDTVSDVYSSYFDLYNNGEKPENITEKLFDEYKEILDDQYDSNNFWFALALAQWETKSLDKKVFGKVKEIIDSGNDLKNWEELGANKSDIKKRQIVLEKFLQKIHSEREKAKLPKIIKPKDPIFKTGDCLTFKLKNGNYGGAIVLGSDFESKHGYNLIASTRINQKERPTLNDFQNAQLLIVNYGNWNDIKAVGWYPNACFKKPDRDLFELVGNIQVDVDYKISNTNERQDAFIVVCSMIIKFADNQFQFEEKNGVIKVKLPIKKIIKNKRFFIIW
ncbi:hypothetical protein KKC94_03440 [Patescibacteria group bacterium]|nr:hypothetical protein [Patescibacteria group bacterium]